jgi:hypothetical protein
MIVSIINMYIYIYPIPGSLKFLQYYVFGIPENYVARLGFEPLKFLYSEFLYKTQAV